MVSSMLASPPVSSPALSPSPSTFERRAGADLVSAFEERNNAADQAQESTWYQEQSPSEPEGHVALGDELLEDGEPEDTGGLSGNEEDDAALTDLVCKNGTPPKITLELLSQHGFYDMPMAKAARILGRTEGSFQRVCRGLGILRWPYRVRKSLQAIMAKTEQYLDDSAQEDGMSKAEVLKVLQAHMDDIKGMSGTGMDKATKQYRQYIFKLNHKLARKAAKQGQEIPASSFKAKGMLKAASRIQKSHNEPQQSPKNGSGKRNGLMAEKPTRPIPRHFKDLPSSLAFSPLGQGEQGDIMGTMATSAAIQSRLKSASPQDYQAACMRNDEELLRLCVEMDSHLQATQQALRLRGPAISQYQSHLTPNAYIQQMLNAAMSLPQGQSVISNGGPENGQRAPWLFP